MNTKPRENKLKALIEKCQKEHSLKFPQAVIVNTINRRLGLMRSAVGVMTKRRDDLIEEFQQANEKEDQDVSAEATTDQSLAVDGATCDDGESSGVDERDI